MQFIFTESEFFPKNLVIKAIGGVNHVFYKLMLFCRVFTKFQVAFYRFQKFKIVFEI